MRIPGLTGFDSGLEWYVSTRSVVCLLLNLSGHKFICRPEAFRTGGAVKSGIATPGLACVVKF